MALHKEEENSLVYGVLLSSVGPGKMTGPDVVYDPSYMDLAMKLHYIKAVYFFNSHAVEGLTTMKIKESMFTWLNDYYMICGRFRRSESNGRPFIKCNDCGVRFIEAQCDKTIDEWVVMGDWAAQKLFAPQQVLGPELTFSPPLLCQVTRFTCGGFSLGISWAHVLGDAFSASQSINRWAQVISGLRLENLPPPNSSNTQKAVITSEDPPTNKDPLSLKRIDPVGDHWITTNNCQMETFSLRLTSTQLTNIQSHISGKLKTDRIPLFESICAVFWHLIAKIRIGSEPRIVTICKKGSNQLMNEVINNSQRISTVKSDFSISSSDLKDLAKLMVDKAVDETSQVEEAVGRAPHGADDFILYGGNLTFVDWEEADLYGLELKKIKPEFVYYSIKGVGEEGAVLVLPGGPKSGGGRLVTVILPADQVVEMQSELAARWFGAGIEY